MIRIARFAEIGGVPGNTKLEPTVSEAEVKCAGDTACEKMSSAIFPTY